MYLLARGVRVDVLRKGGGNGVLRREICDGEKTLTLSCSYRKMQFYRKVYTQKPSGNPLQVCQRPAVSNNTQEIRKSTQGCIS